MNTSTPIDLATRLRSWPRWLWAVAVIIVVGAVVWLRPGGHKELDAATFAARRGPLDITVLEGGSVKAVESQEIKCEVRSMNYNGIKILKIVEEGYEVTDDDIRTNKILVELDSSELQKQIVQQDIQYEQAAASLIDAQQNYEIQLNQNLSDLKAAEQKMRFARMDFDKFLGDNVTQEVIDRLGQDQELAAEETNALAQATAVATAVPRPDQIVASPPPAPPNGSGAAPQVVVIEAQGVVGQSGPLSASPKSPPEPAKSDAPPAKPAPAPAPTRPAVVIDFSKYAHIEVLGDGEAKQKIRKFEDDLQVAQKEEGQAKIKMDGTKRLFEKGFVTKTDMEGDDIAHENSRLKVQTAETARDLFLKYEFPKTAEETLSKYTEAVRELVRARKAALSKLAQAEAKLKSAQGQFDIQSRQRKENYEQLGKCTISAKKPGLVVYGGSRDDMFYYGGEEQIREGATVRERQAIITIPDMSKMSVRVKIHESYIKKVKKGQKARVTVDAFPDKILDGEVTQVGVLPDSQNRWMNPDMKVYLTTITIDGSHEWIKPGMSAKVEVLVDRLADVLYVPVQAVSSYERNQVCYLANGRKPERRVVEVGEFNDSFIEVKSGLKEGERVLLRAAEAPPADQGPAGDTGQKPKTAPKPAAPVAATPVASGH
jgi:multidrug resistance efflux pump